MERLILQELLEWKQSKYRKPMILKGVRQSGKTWALLEFGKRYYENTAYFNFDEQPISDFDEYYMRYKSREVSKVQLAKELQISRPTLDKLILKYKYD